MPTDESREHYCLRKQTVEPVFGMVSEAMEFRQFLRRGLEKVEAEWALASTTLVLKYPFRRSIEENSFHLVSAPRLRCA